MDSIKRFLYFSKIGRKLKLVKTSSWGVALRPASDNNTIMGSNDRQVCFKTIPNTPEYWFADPLLFSDKGKTWLFVEAFNKKEKKGEIGVFDIVNGEASNFQLLITMSTHMSYPFVFKYKDEYYMIPETGAAGKINLYKARSFPYGWELDKVLLDNDCYRDTTVFNQDGQLLMLSYKQNGTNAYNMKNFLTLFELDMENKQINMIKQESDIERTNRPAGPCFIHNGNLYRVTQNCKKIYGESMYVKNMFTENTDLRKDMVVNSLKSSNIVLDGQGNPLVTHTYSQAGGYETIDFRKLL